MPKHSLNTFTSHAAPTRTHYRRKRSHLYRGIYIEVMSPHRARQVSQDQLPLSASNVATYQMEV